MNNPLIKILLGKGDLKDTCVRLIADEQFILMYQCIKPWGRFSTWLLFVSGTVVAIIISNLDSLREVVVYDEDLFTLLKWSVFFGFGVKIFDAIGDFIFVRMNLLGFDALKKAKNFVDEVTLIEGESQDFDYDEIKDLILKEHHKRMPIFLRIIPASKFGSSESDGEVYLFYRYIVVIGLLVLLTCLAQLFTFVIAIAIQLDSLQNQIGEAIGKG